MSEFFPGKTSDFNRLVARRASPAQREILGGVEEEGVCFRGGFKLPERSHIETSMLDGRFYPPLRALNSSAAAGLGSEGRCGEMPFFEPLMLLVVRSGA